MALRIDIASRTHLGLVRKSNQDAALVLEEPDTPKGTTAIAAVADGMGGLPAGDVASSLAIDALRAHLAEAPASQSSTAYLVEAVSKANKAVRDDAQANSTHLGTTLTVVLVINDQLFIGHVGDSRAYLLRAGNLRQLTVDHTWVQEGLEAGMLTPEQAAIHPYRNMLTRSLGLESQVRPFLSDELLKPGDVVLVCSDGLHGEVEATRILDALAEGTAAQSAEALEQLALANGGRDNVTVAVMKVAG